LGTTTNSVPVWSKQPNALKEGVSLDPLKSFGPSSCCAFGRLMRTERRELRCPDASDQQYTLQGTGLYLLASVSTDAQFQQSTPLLDGFAGSTLSVPHPTGTGLCVRLRDNRTAVNKLILPVVPEK
jgi:hypothetical protein